MTRQSSAVMRGARRSRGPMGRHDRSSGMCFDVQRYSLHNGPGIRTTVFLKGCLLSCKWCHNPESLAREPELRVLSGRCVDCGACQRACPLHLADRGHPPDPGLCLRCGACAGVCPTNARELVGRTLTVDEVLALVEADRPFYEESGGGVTFSGGEPLLQWRFLVSCLAALRARGLHTTVDTSGYSSLSVITRVAAYASLFLYDLKVLDPDRHLRFTGVPLEPILRNIRALDEAGTPIWVRIPLVPGYNDDRDNLAATGSFVASLRCTRRVDLIPFHALGVMKHSQFGRQDPMAGAETPASAAIEAASETLRRFGLDVHVGG